MKITANVKVLYSIKKSTTQNCMFSSMNPKGVKYFLRIQQSQTEDF